MRLSKSFSYCKSLSVSLTALFFSICLLPHHLHAQTTPIYGVLNTPGGDNATDTNSGDPFYGKTTTAQVWIALAELANGTSSTCSSSVALNYIATAETAYTQWLNSDLSNSSSLVSTVSIPVDWALFQPQYDNGTPAVDPCYSDFLTDVFGAYASAGYQIALTISVSHGPSWITDSVHCPNCQYKGQSGVHPVPNVTLKDPNGAVITTYYIPNIVWSQQLRLLAIPFIKDVMTLVDNAIKSNSSTGKTQPDLVRLGISENGETRFPLAFNCDSPGYDAQWWAFDNAAQAPNGGGGLRPTEIANIPDCLSGWWPGQTLPTTCNGNPEVPAAQAARDWWSWYFSALADGLAFMYNQVRNNSFTNTISFVTPGQGIDPANIDTYLQMIEANNLIGNPPTTYGYENDDPSETVFAGSAWFVLYDQIIWDLAANWNRGSGKTWPLGTMWIEHSSVYVNSNPVLGSNGKMASNALCGDNGPDLQLSFSPAPSSAASFQLAGNVTIGTSTDAFKTWSTTRKMRLYAYLQNLDFIGETPGNNPAWGQLGDGTNFTGYASGMNDIFNIYNSCAQPTKPPVMKGIFWAFDNQLNGLGSNQMVPGRAGLKSPQTSSPAVACTPGNSIPFPGPDAFIGDYCRNIQGGSISGCSITHVETPFFSPGGGTYTSAQTVTISVSTPGATIRYTTDGSTPSETHGTIYTGPVSITSTTTLQAIGYNTSSYADSNIAAAIYTIN